MGGAVCSAWGGLVAVVVALGVGCGSGRVRARPVIGESRPQAWRTPLDAMTCDGLHVVTAANGAFTSRDGRRWAHERVGPYLRLMRLYCHRGQAWAVGFPGVVVRRAPDGVWHVELRRDEPHPNETHVGVIRAAFQALELVDSRLRAYGRTATGEAMSWEQRGERWLEVPEASAPITRHPESLCGAREVPSSTNREPPPPIDFSGFHAPAPPEGHRHGQPTPFCAAGRAFQWLPIIDEYEEPRGGVLGWQHGARWESVELSVARPIGGVRVGSSLLLVADEALLEWSQ